MQITVNISDSDVLCLSNDLLDINDWVQKAVAGKIAKCKDRMVAEWLPKLMADPLVESIPANQDQLIALIVARDDYSDRVAREATAEQVV